MRTVDANVPRFNQACVAVLTGLAFVLDAWPIVPAVAVVLAVDRFVGPRYGVFSVAYVRLVRPRLEQSIIVQPADPPRFAQALGIVMLGAASVAFVVGRPGVGWLLTLVVTAIATLAAATRICVGCLLYERVAS